MLKILTLILMMVSFLEAKELRIVSYNIHHGAGMDGKLDLKRIAEIIRKEKPDLVALQEVDKNCTRSGNVDQAKALAELLGMHHAYGKTIPLGDGEYGLAVLSKHPIAKSIVHPLPGADRGEARIVFENIITIGKEKISFSSVHLDHKSEPIRLEQVKALNKALADGKHPQIIAGDFNANPDSGSMKLFASEWSLFPKKGPNLTMPANKPNMEIDYIATRGMGAKKLELSCKVLEEKVASDHRPVSGVLRAAK
ncbi:MAG: endonuclease/exonuclease/phosphatase family protein [Akkermansiaceae bacterium]